MFTDRKGGIIGDYTPTFAASYKVKVSLMYFSHFKAVVQILLLLHPVVKVFPDVSE
jgi:hypothetical protein